MTTTLQRIGINNKWPKLIFTHIQNSRNSNQKQSVTNHRHQSPVGDQSQVLFVVYAY